MPEEISCEAGEFGLPDDTAQDPEDRCLRGYQQLPAWKVTPAGSARGAQLKTKYLPDRALTV